MLTYVELKNLEKILKKSSKNVLDKVTNLSNVLANARDYIFYSTKLNTLNLIFKLGNVTELDEVLEDMKKDSLKILLSTTNEYKEEDLIRARAILDLIKFITR